MKILIFCTIILAINSLVPNCAFQSSNKCLSCYYGFDLVSGRCDVCSSGFVMVREICVDQALYQQQVNLQNQLNSYNITTTGAINQQQQSQTTTQQATLTPTPTTILPTQTTQVINQPTTTTTNTVTTTTSSVINPVQATTTTSTVSNAMTFDISNTGVMYLLQMFGLGSKIPANCQQFTNEFKCVQCITGYVVSLTGACANLQSSTTSTSTTSTGATSTTSTGATSTSSQQSSSNLINTQTSSSATGNTLTISGNNDPNCQYPGVNGQCSQCYFRYFYNGDLKKCVQVNDLCATWDKLGLCLTCYGGYKLNNGVCFIDYSTSSATSTTAGSTQGTGSTSTGSTSIGSASTGSASTGSTSTATTVQSTASTNQQQQSVSTSTTTTSQSDINCKYPNINGGCFECYYSYYYNTSTGRCVSVNPLCQTWNYLGYCFSCFPGYALNGTQCIVSSSSTTGTAVNTGSLSTTTSGSSNSSSTSSTTGVQISGSTSTTGQVTVINSDPNCRTPNQDGTCNSCYNTFYYDSINAKRCISVNPLCKTWNTQGYCLSCYQGYLLSSNNCVIQSAYLPSVQVGINDLPLTNQDPNCNTYSNQVCVKCATRTYLDPTTKRCLAVDANCLQWTDTGICTGCYNGYYLFNQKQCRLFYPEVASVQLKSSLNSDLNCRASDSNGVCTQCIWRFVLHPTSKTCMKVNDLCKNWSETTALCTGCYGGYTLTTGGQCKISY